MHGNGLVKLGPGDDATDTESLENDAFKTVNSDVVLITLTVLALYGY